MARSGASHQLAALPVSGGTVYAEFVPHTHLVLFGPTVAGGVLPDLLNPDAPATYRSLCTSTQRVLTPAAWSRYVPAGIPYEPPC